MPCIRATEPDDLMRSGGQCENRQVGIAKGTVAFLWEFEIGVVEGALEGFGGGWVGGFAA